MRKISSARKLTLIEVIVSTALLALLLLGFLLSSISAENQREFAREEGEAHRALENYIELLKSLRIEGILATKTPPPIPDNFLKDAVGTLLLPATTPGLPATIGEDGGSLSSVEKKALGFPLDLNGDGDTNDTGLTHTDLLILPVKVSLVYQSKLGMTREVTLYAVFSDH